MDITRYEAAPSYEPPGHDGMRCLRMLGREAGPADFAWMGLSFIEPGGVIHPSTAPLEKLYLVVEGELVFESGERSATLHRWDACRIAAGEDRTIRNQSGRPATLVLTMANARPEDAGLRRRPA